MQIWEIKFEAISEAEKGNYWNYKTKGWICCMIKVISFDIGGNFGEKG